jgi:hypothetical protein
VLVETADALPADGAWVNVDQALLERTPNVRLLSEGQAYYTVYTSAPVSHRSHLRSVADKARTSGVGVWGETPQPTGCWPIRPPSGPTASSSCPSFPAVHGLLQAVDKGFIGNLGDWLLASSATPTRDENDRVLLRDTTEVHLSDLQQRNQHIAFQADLLDLTLVEK